MIDLNENRRRRAALIVPALLLGLALSACGSASTYGSGSSPTSPASSGAASGAEKVATAHGADGTYLTGDDGRAVYLWEADTHGTSTCSGACAGAWPPMLTTGAPIASGGAIAGDLGTVRRSDGSMQVTYQGHPLYYYAGDSAAGQTNGQGSNGFGATWWLVSPAGAAITGAGSGGSSSGGGGW